MKSMRKGFTLIELMIVIAIIAVIAAIAIPSLVASITSSNETIAVTNLRGLATAQSMFKKRLWYPNLGAKCMANGATDMYQISPANRPELIDKALNDAFGTAFFTLNGTPKAGYLLRDYSQDSLGAQVSGGDPGAGGASVNGFTYISPPAEFDRTGRTVFVMNENGAVYGQDFGSKAASNGVVVYPILATEPLWIAAGN